MRAMATDREQDRLALMILLALALHASIILGVNFRQELRHYAPPKLEITLAQHHDIQPPDQADFLAQANQQGSGTLDEARQLTATEQPEFQDSAIHEISPRQQLAASDHSAMPTQISSLRSEPTQTASLQPANAARDTLSDLTTLQRNQEIASLEAQLDAQRQAYAKRPRIRRLTSTATRQADDALYLHHWRTRVEAVGNRHYPEEARARGIFGELRMMVALLPNGEIHDIKVLKSSGSALLDQAAIRIVHLAAPFEPFSSTMERNVDVLEIIRTWRFHEDQVTSSS